MSDLCLPTSGLTGGGSASDLIEPVIMPRKSYDVRTLRAQAISSLRTGVTAFNALENNGRVTTVLIHLKHCFEMFLEAALLPTGDKNVFDKGKRVATD